MNFYHVMLSSKASNHSHITLNMSNLIERTFDINDSNLGSTFNKLMVIDKQIQLNIQ